jgi:hypothetical protein
MMRGNRRRFGWALAAAIAGGAWLFSSCGRKSSGPGGSAGADVLQVQSLELRREGDHALLAVRILPGAKFPAGAKLRPPDVKLLHGGEEVPEFIRPFRDAPEADPPAEAGKSSSAAVVRFWLGAAQLAGPLELECAGQRIALKSAGAFSIEQVADQTTVALAFPDWKPL